MSERETDRLDRGPFKHTLDHSMHYETMYA
jgi:hypothetical protein